jgi:hypothetical protein
MTLPLNVIPLVLTPLERKGDYQMLAVSLK